MAEARGFTLIELLAALMILAFGVTTVFGVFSTGLATEQNAELVRDAARLATAVRERIEREGLVGGANDALPAPIIGARHADFPGLAYDLDFEPGSSDSPNEVFARIRVRWLRVGQDVSEMFRFPLPRGTPLHLRIRRLLEPEGGSR